MLLICLITFFYFKMARITLIFLFTNMCIYILVYSVTDEHFTFVTQFLCFFLKAIEALSIANNEAGDANGEYATKCIKHARDCALCCEFNQYELEKSSRELDLLQKQLSEKLTQGKSKKVFSFSRRRVQEKKALQKVEDHSTTPKAEQITSREQSKIAPIEGII